MKNTVYSVSAETIPSISKKEWREIEAARVEITGRDFIPTEYDENDHFWNEVFLTECYVESNHYV